MKRYLMTFLMLSALAIMFPLFTQTSYGQSRCYNFRTKRYYWCKKPNFYRRHRKLINIGGGAAGGALLGGLLGGKKGAIIGGAAGAGTGYIVTKKQKRKNYNRPYRP